MWNKIRNRFLVHFVLFLAFFFFAAGVVGTAERIPAAQKEQQVHTLYWKARLRRNIKVKGKKIKRGSIVTVIKRQYYSSKKHTVRYKNLEFKLSSSAISYICDMVSVSKGDYSKRTKEDFVNKKKKVKSKTKWLIWISLDKQRVNVFHGSKGKWKLEHVFKCSTGKISTPTPTGWYKIDFKNPNVKGCRYYTEVCGSGLHQWPGAMNNSIMGKHTVSKGCIRLYEKNAIWIYRHVPTKSTVVIY